VFLLSPRLGGGRAGSRPRGQGATARPPAKRQVASIGTDAALCRLVDVEEEAG
jgi:hypothetical protein